MEIDDCLPTNIFDDNTSSPSFLTFDDDLFPPSICSSDDMSSTAEDFLNCVSPSGSDGSVPDSLFYSNGLSTSEGLTVMNSPAGSESSVDSLLSPSTFDLEEFTLSVTDSSEQLQNVQENFPMDFDWTSTLHAADLAALNESMVTTIASENLPGFAFTPVLTTSTSTTKEQTTPQTVPAVTVTQITPATTVSTNVPTNKALSTFMIVKTQQAKPTLTVAPTKTILVASPAVKPAAPKTSITTVAEPTKAVLLQLTEEEKRLLKEEGAQLPTDVPLTKAEQKTLKKVRRKIKNKQSAQESRRKKKEYIDGLERRVKICTDQNMGLQKKVEELEKSNSTLMDELKRLQTLVTSTNPTKAQAGTCLMVVVLAFALVLAPLSNNFGSSDKTVPTAQSAYSTVSVRSRTLLQISEDSDNSHLDGGNNVPNISEYLKGLTFSLGLTKDGGIADAKSANFVDSHNMEKPGDYSHLERKDTYSRLESV